MNYTDKLSVIIPFFNEEGFIKNHLESIRNSKKFDAINFFYIDDESKDKSPNIVREYSKAFENIHCIKLENNVGPAAAFNIGMSHVRTKYIAKCDADDIVLPNRWVTQLNYMEKNPDVVASGTSFYYFDFHNNDFRLIFKPTDPQWIKFLLNSHSPINAGTAIFRSKVLKSIGGYSINPKYQFAENLELYKRLSKFGSLTNISIPTYIYMYNYNSINRSSINDNKARNRSNYEILKDNNSILYAWIWRFYPYLKTLKIQKLFKRIVGIKEFKLSREEVDSFLKLWT